MPAISNEDYWRDATNTPAERGDVVHLVIDGCPPGYGRKNTKYRGRRSKLLSDEYKTFANYVWAAWVTAGSPRLDCGAVAIAVHVYWARERKLPDGHRTAYADVDAVTSAVLDGLQDKTDKAGVRDPCLLDDDMRIEDKRARKFVDKAWPRVEVWVWAV